MKRFLTRVLHEAREGLTPVATTSTFVDTGQLTPEEFVTAGDHLVKKWPFWEWRNADFSENRKTYLPPGKQYLATGRIVSTHRYREIVTRLGASENNERLLSIDGNEWIEPLKVEPSRPQNPTIPDADAPEAPGINGLADHFAELKLGPDEGVLSEEEDTWGITEEDDALRLVRNDPCKNWRYYDLHITYDNYYRTPRLWIIGYDAYRNQLTSQEIFEDISPEHSEHTVTLERHPYFYNQPCLSVHPCQHAKMLKRLSALSASAGKAFETKKVLELFLKVMVTVLPTADFMARGMV